MPGLWGAGLAFFAVNCWILGIVVSDIGALGREDGKVKDVAEKKGEKKVVVG